MREATTPGQAAPPSFLGLAGHPVRWRLLTELSHSDRRVGELCARLELPQNLVSYHLGRLRAERVVSRRRSSADGRDSYYVLELDRCGDLLARAGSALHPGLQLAPVPDRRHAPTGPDRRRAPTVPDRRRAPTVPDRRHATGRRRHVRVLFLCTGNSARSQIAEALAERLGGGVIEARSAGSHPKPLHPNAVRVLAERGIDIAGRRSKHLEKFVGRRFDYVVSLCDRLREICPEFPGHPDLIHWSIPDPAREGDSDEETYPAFERTADELATRIAFLLELVEHALADRPNT